MMHRSKPRNNPLDVFWGLETIIMPLTRHPQKKVFLPYASFPRAKSLFIKILFDLYQSTKKRNLFFFRKIFIKGVQQFF